jgi:hypothetical protein
VMYGDGIRRDCVTVRKFVVYSVAAGLEGRDWTSKGNAFVVACDLDGSRGSLGKEIGEICSWEWHLFTHGRQILFTVKRCQIAISVVRQVLNWICATKIHSELQASNLLEILK